MNVISGRDLEWLRCVMSMCRRDHEALQWYERHVEAFLDICCSSISRAGPSGSARLSSPCQEHALSALYSLFSHPSMSLYVRIGSTECMLYCLFPWITCMYNDYMFGMFKDFSSVSRYQDKWDRLHIHLAHIFFLGELIIWDNFLHAFYSFQTNIITKCK